MNKKNGKKLLGNIKYFDSYSKTKHDGTKESWSESCLDVMSMYKNKFKNNEGALNAIKIAEESYLNKLVLASQRSLQYREEQIIKHNARLFNCASTFIDRPDVVKQIMYALCAAGSRQPGVVRLLADPALDVSKKAVPENLGLIMSASFRPFRQCR